MKALVLGVLLSGQPSISNEAIMDNLKETAASCFQIGYVLKDMKDNPGNYLPGSFEKAEEEAYEACYVHKSAQEKDILDGNDGN